MSQPVGTVTAMAKERVEYVCSKCLASFPKWSGQCSNCEEWNTLAAVTTHARLGVVPAVSVAAPVPLGDVDAGLSMPRPTGVSEFDRVLSGGLVPGSATLIGGEPGVGKSTLALQIAVSMANSESKVLYVSGEESLAQIRRRGERLNGLASNVLLSAESSLESVVAMLRDVRPSLCVIDSIQTLSTPEVSGGPGSVSQVRTCAQSLISHCKANDIALVLIGHVTKDGQLAGPRVLEHAVDTVLSFEGERHQAMRMLRLLKHRFGPTDQLGVFEMTHSGLTALADPSSFLLQDQQDGRVGSTVVPALEGNRPLLLEVQALLTPNQNAQPRRSAQGLDSTRLAVLSAVLQERVGIPTQQFDIYLKVTGGVRLNDPASDLAICLAMISSLSNWPLPSHLVVCGEVGLGGEVRSVPNVAARLNEAARLGFNSAVVPQSAPDGVIGLDLMKVQSVAELATRLELAQSAHRVIPHLEQVI